VTIAQLPIPELMRPNAKRGAKAEEPIIVDLFAGGGGASTGIEDALGRAVDEAINHDDEAIQMHARNHPRTRHHTASVWEKKPRDVVGNRRVGLLWLSPDCTDFSRAKGGQPIRDRRIRSLAWVGCKWAKVDNYDDAEQRPERIILENVREFEEWGPLIHQPAKDGSGFMWQISRKPIIKKGRRKGKRPKAEAVVGPKHDATAGPWLQFWKSMGYRAKPLMIRDPKRLGQTFKRFVRQLERYGYKVEWRVLNAADYGAPTIRKRFFLIARRDGKAIVWPQPTHGPVEKCNGKGASTNARTNQSDPRNASKAGAVENASSDARGVGKYAQGSLYAVGREQCDPARGAVCPTRIAHNEPRKPYRTASECIDWSISCPSIFGRKRELAPNTKRRIVMGMKRYVFESVAPFLVQVNHGGDEFRGQAATSPMPTLTQKHGVVAPVMTKNAVNEKPHHGLGEPLHTITTIHNKFQLATAQLAPYITRCAHGEGVNGRWGLGAHDLKLPLSTLTASKDFALTSLTLAPLIVHRYGEAPNQETRGQSANAPLNTITPSNNTGVLIAPTLVKNNFGEKQCQELATPLHTITTQGNKFAIAAATLLPFVAGVGGRAGQSLPTPGDGPIGTITAKNDRAVVAAHISKYYGGFYEGHGSSASAPLHTITAQDHNALASAFITRIGQSGGNGNYTYKPDASLTTITTKAEHCLTFAYLTKLRGSGGWKDVAKPLDTICAGAATFAVTTPFLTILRNHCDAAPLTAPTPTIVADGQHLAIASPFAIKYYGVGTGQTVSESLHTITTKDRFGLAIPMLAPLPTQQMGRAVDVYRFLISYKHLLDGVPNVTFHELEGGGYVTVCIGSDQYLITDIGLRMLTPIELLRAQFSPELAEGYLLPESNAAAVHKIGNSVPPLVASALVKANCPDLITPPVKRKQRAA
jgi:DNA (cytosine-5)-methyltransferase 1